LLKLTVSFFRYYLNVFSVACGNNDPPRLFNKLSFRRISSLELLHFFNAVDLLFIQKCLEIVSLLVKK